MQEHLPAVLVAAEAPLGTFLPACSCPWRGVARVNPQDPALAFDDAANAAEMHAERVLLAQGRL
jgi:hypothetical protein